MKTIVSRFAWAIACTLVLLATAVPALAQLDPTDVPEPPAAELAALERFFGSYEHTGQYFAGLGPWAGTLEVHPAVKGWYVEFVIDTRFGPIDRQLTLLTTYDTDLGHYRVWRFETFPQSPPGTLEAAAWFEGEVFVMQWRDQLGPNGEHGVFRNRVSMEGPNTLVITSDVDPDWADPIQLGVWRSQRTTVGRSR